MEASEHDHLPEEEILGQMSCVISFTCFHTYQQPALTCRRTLIFAAMDTTSSALSRILHLLSQRQELQDQLRAELVEARKVFDGDFDYDCLMELPFLEAVCRETLRL